MNTALAQDINDSYTALTAPDTVRVDRLLPGPMERVWRYLTEPELRAQWLAAGDMALRTGGAVGLVFNNNKLTAGDDAPPAKYAAHGETHQMQGHITACEPTHLLAYTWGEESGTPSEVRFELSPKGDKVLLKLTHTRLGQASMLSVSAGWHTHLSILLARLGEGEVSGFWRTFARLETEYAARLG